jgi:hypothetical protein
MGEKPSRCVFGQQTREMLRGVTLMRVNSQYEEGKNILQEHAVPCAVVAAVRLAPI